MIPAIDMALSQWGRWAVAGASRAIGYAKTCPMFKDAGGGSYGSEIPAGVGMAGRDMPRIDSAVKALPAVHRAIVIAHYQHGSSKRESARRCGIKRGLFDRFLTEAHLTLDKWLRDDQNPY